MPDLSALVAQAERAAAEAKAAQDAADALKRQLDEAKQAGNGAADELRRYVDQQRQRARVSALRRMGLKGEIPESEALRLMPDVDPDSPDGAAQIDEWRQRSSFLFVPRGAAPEVAQQQLADSLPKAPTRKLFGDDFARNQIASVYRRMK